uniref:Uncharacterized protein n=1 Tax=Ascaris lumbricoides TaxID=6252 RepID=A0A9J2PT47_ASCLU
MHRVISNECDLLRICQDILPGERKQYNCPSFSCETKIYIPSWVKINAEISKYIITP